MHVPPRILLGSAAGFAPPHFRDEGKGRGDLGLGVWRTPAAPKGRDCTGRARGGDTRQGSVLLLPCGKDVAVSGARALRDTRPETGGVGGALFTARAAVGELRAETRRLSTAAALQRF